MNGVLVINKPKGFTSRDVVNKVSNLLGTKKIGHTGTLDPIATGVLVLCIGSSLKLVELLMNHDKEYVARVRLGVETDTLDITGNVVKEDYRNTISRDDVIKVLCQFVGKIKQQVPAYSSVKVQGKKLYQYARNNEVVELPIRDVEIYSLELLDFDNNNQEFVIRCRVSKGTYIRSLVRDIGYALGTYATMLELERTSLGNFLLSDSFTLEEIEMGKYRLLSPMEAVHLPVVCISDSMEKKVKNGQVLPALFDDEMVYLINSKKEVLAIYQRKDDKFVKPYRMFQFFE